MLYNFNMYMDCKIITNQFNIHDYIHKYFSYDKDFSCLFWVSSKYELWLPQHALLTHDLLIL